MASLLSKFRIDYSDLTVIPNITKRAENSTRSLFETLIKDFKGDPDKAGKGVAKGKESNLKLVGHPIREREK
jgi:hypothetical protein